MAIKKIQKTITPQTIYLSLAAKYSPLWAPGFICFLGFLFILWPSLQRVSKLSAEIQEKDNIVTTVTRNKVDMVKMRADLIEFKRNVREFEEKLPMRSNTNLIIETLQEITKQSKLKFSSLEPLPIKKHVLEETKDSFVELPVRIRLNCGYYDLVDFIKKIETADQLMKITDLSIRDEPTQDFEHVIELSVSAFSREPRKD